MKFVLIQNINCPGIEPDWYRKIDDLAELDAANTAHAQQYFVKSFEDPHFEAALKKGDVRACVIHPMNVLPKRATAMIKHFLREGHILINRCGGWCFLTESLKVWETIESDKWPAKEVQGQFVYVHKWPLGNHWYLIGWPRTLSFSAAKFNTPEKAIEEAKRHVPENRIQFKPPPVDRPEPFVYPVEGD